MKNLARRSTKFRARSGSNKGERNHSNRVLLSVKRYYIINIKDYLVQFMEWKDSGI